MAFSINLIKSIAYKTDWHGMVHDWWGANSFTIEQPGEEKIMISNDNYIKLPVWNSDNVVIPLTELSCHWA